MCIAAAELKKCGDNSEDENIEGSTEESSSEDGAVKEDWVDEDKPTTGQAKCKWKILLSVDKVRTIIQSLLILSLTQTFPQLHAIVVDIL